MAIINCPECGAKVSDKSPKCVKCGHSFTVESNGVNVSGLNSLNNDLSYNYKVEKYYKQQKGLCVFGCIIGIAIAILGFLILTDALGIKYNSNYLSSTSFGGDFYTYQYKATVAAAENVSNIGELLLKIFHISGVALLLVGLLVFISFAKKVNKVGIELEKWRTQNGLN